MRTTYASYSPDRQSTAMAAIESPVESVVHDAAALRRIRRDGIVGLGETYIDGLWDVDHLDVFMHQVFSSPAPDLSPFAWARLLLAAMDQRIFNRQAGEGAFNIGIEHYDLGNDLFRVMLDSSMTYTSGYWADAADLEEAQRAKLDLLCRKLDLAPGMRVLDIGCGWGNFACHAASRYGVHVTGVTVSREQAAIAQQRCSDLPVDIRVQDYRDVQEIFDRIVSIEMIEAVGRKNMPTYYSMVDRCLQPGGLFALQAISGNTLTRTSDRRLDQYILWLVRHIFPDGYLPKPAEMTRLDGTSLRVEDWQSFADDYDRTLMAWAQRFNAAWDQLAAQYGERFRRRWHFYLYGCAAAFRAGLVDVYQIVYSKAGRAWRYQPVR